MTIIIEKRKTNYKKDSTFKFILEIIKIGENNFIRK